MVTVSPIYIHIIHHHDDIININIISSKCHYPTSTLSSSHININIISSQYHHYHNHQHHLISLLSQTSTSSHLYVINAIHNHISHIYIINFLSEIYTLEFFRQHKSQTTTIHNVTRLVF